MTRPRWDQMTDIEKEELNNQRRPDYLKRTRRDIAFSRDSSLNAYYDGYFQNFSLFNAEKMYFTDVGGEPEYLTVSFKHGSYKSYDEVMTLELASKIYILNMDETEEVLWEKEDK